MIRPVRLTPGSLIRVQIGVASTAERDRLGVWRLALPEAVVDAVVHLDGPVAADHARQRGDLRHVRRVLGRSLRLQSERARMNDLAQTALRGVRRIR